MAKKTKKNPVNGESSRQDQMMVLLENMQDQIQLVAEGNTMLNEKMDAGFKKINQRMDSMEGRMDSMEGRMDSMENEMHIGFKSVLGELAKIENEKADKKDLLILKTRVDRLEIAKK